MAWQCKKSFNSKELFILHMFPWNTETCLSFIVNIMGVDGLVMQAAMAWWNQNIPAHLLLMLWLLASPGHRLPWCWLCRTRRSLSLNLSHGAQGPVYRSQYRVCWWPADKRNHGILKTEFSRILVHMPLLQMYWPRCPGVFWFLGFLSFVVVSQISFLGRSLTCQIKMNVTLKI